MWCIIEKLFNYISSTIWLLQDKNQLKPVKQLYLVVIRNFYYYSQPVPIFLRSLMRGCHIYFLTALTDHLLVFENECFRNYVIKPLKTLLKHSISEYKIVISQEKRCSSTDLKTNVTSNKHIQELGQRIKFLSYKALVFIFIDISLSAL